MEFISYQYSFEQIVEKYGFSSVINPTIKLQFTYLELY